MSHKIVPPKYYFINAAVLGVLMTATVAVAKYPLFHLSDNPNGLNLLIAVLIAIAKAACIVSIFMGAYWSSGLVRLFAALGFIWLSIFFLFTFTDYGFANPLEDFGAPYNDLASPGSNPQPGGQNFSTHGLQLAPAHGGGYVPPPHLFGHGEEAAAGEHGAAESHGADASAPATPADAGQH
jgi:caa(3)-type oxidase subunit IV